MANPVICEVTRGNVVESRHRGSVAVVDADGVSVLAIGDVERPVFPRSAVKVIQALPLVESGAADAFSFGDRELALACASHFGEPAHADLAKSMLARAGLSMDDLECGAHWPAKSSATRKLARQGGSPCPLHNNCSGKHSGFLCTCVHLGIDFPGYTGRDHAFQRELTGVMEEVTGTAHAVDNCGIDGCSIPTHAVPLRNLALGFARMATGAGLSAQRAEAAQRLFKACTAEPFFVEGTDGPCTALLKTGRGELFAKNGAEGVYCGAMPSLGLGMAVKCDDGSMRAAVSVFTAVAARMLRDVADVGPALAAMANKPLLNRNGWTVGEVRPVI